MQEPSFSNRTQIHATRPYTVSVNASPGQIPTNYTPLSDEV